MFKKILKSKSVLVLSLGFSLFSSGVFAQEYDRRRDDRRDVHKVEVRHDVHRDGRHYYRNGHWYRRGWFGMGVAVPVLSTGVLVDSLPSTYTVVVVGGNTYYHGDGLYFKQMSQGGFSVVSTP